MLMDMLARQPQRLQMLARGAFSINLQQTTAAALARGEFPEKTPTEPDRWNWVHCQIRSPQHKKPVDLIMPDMAGEALLEEVDHPQSYQVIRALLSRSSGVLIMLDASQFRQGTLDQDYYAMKLLNYLNELDDHPKQGWAHRPIALVFSKADECEECLHDPAGYAQAHASGLWRQAQERFTNIKFFAAGVAGACAYRQTRNGRVRVPLRTEPHGVVEPFEWLVHQFKY
jgi:hypothetical protein